MNRFLLIALSFVAMAVLVISCGQSDSKVIAEIAGDDYTVKDFEDYARGYVKGKMFSTAQEEYDFKRSLLDSMVVTRLLVNAAKECGLDQSEEIARVVAYNRERFLVDALYQQEIGNKIECTEAEIRNYWEHLDIQIRASHILLNNEDTAKALFQRLVDGASFEQLAYEYSADPSAKRNRGDLGYFTWGTMIDEFQDVAFNMEVGELSQPIKSQFGYHIIKLTDKKPYEGRSPYSEMKPELKRRILSRKQANVNTEFMNKMMAKYPVSIDTSVCNYILHKRLQLYPPQLLDRIPKSTFDEEQLSRDERELPLATWVDGQVSLGEYVNWVNTRFQDPTRLPPFDNPDSLATAVFSMKWQEIYAHEAIERGLEQSDEFKRSIQLFKDLTMAEIMRKDSLPQPAVPTEDELREFYDSNQPLFLVPAQIHLYEILVSDQGLAQRLAKEIKSLEEFRRKAAEYTERSAARTNRGDLGYVEEKWFPNIFPAAWETPLGRIGGPVLSKNNKYSVFYPVDRRPEEYQDFLKVKNGIQSKLIEDRTQAIFDNWLTEHKASADIELNEELIWETVDSDFYQGTSTESENG